MEEFGSLLRHFRERQMKSQRELATAVNQSVSHLSRLEQGERQPSNRQLVLHLARALGLDAAETDQLLEAAGHPPATVEKLGLRDPTLVRVAEVLADESLSKQDRNEFRRVIESIAKHWRLPLESRG